MVWMSPAHGSKSEDNMSTVQGVWPANFEHLRETKDLSALAHVIFAHRKLSRHTGDDFARISKLRLASPEALPRNISSGHDSPYGAYGA